MVSKTKEGIAVRCLSIPQETLLLLQLFDFLLIAGKADQLVDILKIPLGRYLEPCVLLSDAISP